MGFLGQNFQQQKKSWTNITTISLRAITCPHHNFLFDTTVQSCHIWPNDWRVRICLLAHLPLNLLRKRVNVPATKLQPFSSRPKVNQNPSTGNWPIISMSTASPSLRQRGKKGRATTPLSDAQNGTVELVDKAQPQIKSSISSEWDYKLVFAIITLLGFATRFYGISHPDQVVFDEVHFGKVRDSQLPPRTSFCPKATFARPKILTACTLASLHPIIYNECTFSMSILPSESFSLRSQAGSSDIGETFSSTTLEIPTSSTKSHMSLIVPFQL